jgi:serine/threonine protein kinase
MNYHTPSTLLQNRYEVSRLVGIGGMGAVYEAFDRRLNKRIALKQLKPALQITPTARQAFAREAQLLASLRHPALPVVSDHFEEGADLYLVMDFIPGDDLKAMLDQRSTPFSTLRRRCAKPQAIRPR